MGQAGERHLTAIVKYWELSMRHSLVIRLASGLRQLS